MRQKPGRAVFALPVFLLVHRPFVVLVPKQPKHQVRLLQKPLLVVKALRLARLLSTKKVVFVMQTRLPSLPLAGTDPVKLYRLVNFRRVWLPERAKLDGKPLPVLWPCLPKAVHRTRVLLVTLMRRPLWQGKLRVKAVRHYVLFVNLVVPA